jgi:hypothetical protein
MLTRQQMLDIVRRGETVLYTPPGGTQARQIASENEVPTDLELAGNDPDKKQAAVTDLERQMEDIQRQLAEARGAQGASGLSEGEEKGGGESAPNLANMNKTRLLKVVEDEKVEGVDQSNTKEQLIEAIEKHRAANPGGGGD